MSEYVDLIKRKSSGSEYRKRKAEKKKEFQKTKKFMNIEKYITTKNQDLNVTSTSEIATNASVDQIVIEDIVDKVSTCDGNVQLTPLAMCIQIPDDLSTVFMNISDPLIRNSKVIDHIISNCQVQTHIDNYPKSDSGRHFSNCHFTKKLANNETIQRRRLIYSVSKDQVYRFCCRLFDSKSTSSLVSKGYNNWKHLSEMSKIHESSTSHKKFYLSWIDTELRLKAGKTRALKEQFVTNVSQTSVQGHFSGFLEAKSLMTSSKSSALALHVQLKLLPDKTNVLGP
ncbi:zinc finger MYM-type protein 5-like [Hydra vulgaris]|uniref:Zinc finger MYM-type protein 5-like n=1 Tax=Hydra vulgaris TaxID=6087 RepID=A0ABM4DML7_HYDVU